MVAFAFAGLGMALYEQHRWAWYTALIAAVGDAGFVVVTASPGLFGSMAWPLVAVVLLLTASTR